LIDGVYEYNELKRKDHDAAIHLTNVEIFYGEESTRNYADSLVGFFKIPYNPIFPSDKNHLTFSFNRVDKSYPKSVRFKYMLKNYDQGWSIPSANKQVTYSNLPPGNYEFQVMATNSKGSWSEVRLHYPFAIKAPFYMTATFMFIAILLLLGLIIFISYLRVRQRVEKAMTLERIRVREQESLRKEIARDFHDEMGNQLTRIINYISLLKLNGIGYSNGNSNGKGNGDYLSNHDDLYTKVENSAKYLYNGTRDFIWAIDPVNDELSKLFIHIRDFGEKLFEEKGIQFRANNGVKEKIRLPYGFSREVNLIFKEAMTNTFKYAQAQNATLSLQRDGLGFEFYFEDDGIGFNASDIEKLNGLKNIRERADKIQAVLRIRSKEGSGTKVSLSFQFTKTQQYGTTV
jgi:signal transduction histidine kinase